MIKKLPIGHPRMKGCVNPRKNQEEYEPPSFEDWDELDNGSMCIVFVQLPYEEEDVDMWNSIKKFNSDACYQSLASSGLIPLRVQKWMTESMMGDWLYQVLTDHLWTLESSSSNTNIVFKLIFQKKQDAAMFKLRWDL